MTKITPEMAKALEARRMGRSMGCTTSPPLRRPARAASRRRPGQEAPDSAWSEGRKSMDGAKEMLEMGWASWARSPSGLREDGPDLLEAVRSVAPRGSNLGHWVVGKSCKRSSLPSGWHEAYSGDREGAHDGRFGRRARAGRGGNHTRRPEPGRRHQDVPHSGRPWLHEVHPGARRPGGGHVGGCLRGA